MRVFFLRAIPAIALIAGLLTGLTFGYLYATNIVGYDGLAQEIDQLKTRLTERETMISEMNATINNLKSLVENMTEKLGSIEDRLSENSLSLFDADLNFGEALRLVRYKGELYIVHSPLGQVWKFDSKCWKMVYDVGENIGHAPINASSPYSKWAFTSWDAHHWSKDDKLYFAGNHYHPTGGVAILRYSKTADEWEFFDLVDTIGTGEFESLEEFGDHLYGGTNRGEVWRTVDGQNWTKVFEAIPGYNFVQSLVAGGSPNRLRVGLNSEENGNVVWNNKGRVYATLDGLNWTEELRLPEGKGGVSAMSYGGSVGGDYCLLGTNLGYIYLWDGGYRIWRQVGRVDLPVLDIRQHSGSYFYPDWLITCGARWGGGAIWRWLEGRLLQIMRSFSHSIFSAETLNGELYYSWGWTDLIGGTYVRGHYAGVKETSEILLNELMRQPATPYTDRASTVTNDSDQTLIQFNLGTWSNRVLCLRNNGLNEYRFHVLGSINGIDYFYLETDRAGPAPGAPPREVDFSKSAFAAIRIDIVNSLPGQSTDAEASISCW